MIWDRVIAALAEGFDVVAPDLRGFGATDKPVLAATDGYTIDHHVGDLLGLADGLGFERFGVVSHDVGAYMAQAFARAHPDRLAGLFFFELVGSSRRACEVYFRHFMDHWAGSPEAFAGDCDFEAVEGAGHYVARERPGLAAREITDFFSGG